MSWEPYVQNLVAGGFHHGCIAGHNGQIWGSTANFTVLPKEIVRLCTILNETDGARLAAEQRGFTVQGRSYAMNRLEESEDDMAFLVARCKQHGSASRGLIVACTPQTIIVGVHDPIFSPGISFGRAKVAIFQLAETLTSMNF